MGILLRRSRAEVPPALKPIDEDKQNNAIGVVETLNILNLPPEKMIILGGAAITLLGLERHAHDIDGILHPSLHQEIEETKLFPGGAPAEPTEPSEIANFQLGRLQSQPTISGMLATEWFLPDYRSCGPRKLAFKFDELFESGIGTTSGYRILDTEQIIAHKQSRVLARLRTPYKRALDAYDVGLLREYDSRQRKGKRPQQSP